MIPPSPPPRVPCTRQGRVRVGSCRPSWLWTRSAAVRGLWGGARACLVRVGRPLLIRVCRNLQDLDPTLRGPIKIQDFFQDLEGQEPRFCRSQDAFGLWVPKGSNSWKMCAARAPQRRPMTIEYRDMALEYSNSEDPAKMTHSIPDFVSRNRAKNQDFFQYLEGGSPRIKIKT